MALSNPRPGSWDPSMSGPLSPSGGGSAGLGGGNGGFRFGASPEFMAKLKTFGKAAGPVIAGVPIALAAVGELGKSGNPATDLAGAAGQVGGGLLGGLGAAALAAPLGPVASTLAFGVGSLAGGQGLSGIARWAADTAQGINDPIGKEINERQRRATAEIDLYKLQAAAQDEVAAREMERQLQARSYLNNLAQANAFQAAALQGAMSGVSPQEMAYYQGLS